MGVFDTFYGKIKCEYCNEEHDFEEQTKAYKCLMKDYTIGDYISDESNTYIYPFDTFCTKTFKETGEIKNFVGNIIIVNGQIVKVVNSKQLKNINIHKLKNIKKDCTHKLEYIEECNKGAGYAKEKVKWNEHPKKINDEIVALNTRWIIKEIYKETLIHDSNYNVDKLNKVFYQDNFIYKVESKQYGSRIIRIKKNNIEVFYNKGDYKHFDINEPYKFILQSGTILEKIK